MSWLVRREESLGDRTSRNMMHCSSACVSEWFVIERERERERDKVFEAHSCTYSIINTYTTLQ